MMVIRKIMKITVVVIGDFLDDDDDGDDDDIYNDGVYVCLSVTFLLILPSPCQAGDICIMMKCVYVCVSRFCLFCLTPAKLTIYI